MLFDGLCSVVASGVEGCDSFLSGRYKSRAIQPAVFFEWRSTARKCVKGYLYCTFLWPGPPNSHRNHCGWRSPDVGQGGLLGRIRIAAFHKLLQIVSPPREARFVFDGEMWTDNVFVWNNLQTNGHRIQMCANFSRICCTVAYDTVSHNKLRR